jgi:hypothetical protein
MNDRFMELAEVAGVTVLTTRGHYSVKDGCFIVSPDKLEQFAQLLVRTCAGLCLINDPGDATYFGQQAAEKYIKLHFGVE